MRESASGPKNGLPQTDYDPITFSVMLGRFESIVREMTTTLEQTAWSSILSVCLDFSCAIYDARARQVSMFDALPIHTTSLRLVLEEIARTYEGEVHEGDVILCNDPYRFNTHIGDLVTACPVFVDGQHLFWSVTKGHQMDTGAYLPSSVVASAQNIWQEGIQIPPIKIIERGKKRRDVIDLYLANMRYRDVLEGDLLAQLASIEIGRERLLELCGEYGATEVRRYVDAIIDYADRRMSSELQAIPDGTYSGRAWIDSDGVSETNIPICVRVVKDGDRVVVDYTGSGPQASGGVNGSFATSQAAGAIPFLYYVSPDIPHNEGCIKHIEVIAPEGTIVHARHPASTSAATGIPSDTMIEAVNRAMVQAVPALVPAGSTKVCNLPQLSGVDAKTGEAWGVMLFNGTGGSGASRGADGWPLFESMDGMGATRAEPIEQVEMLYPILIEKMEIDPDSMGLGQWIGGPGTLLVVHSLTGDTECVTFGDGVANPPSGVLGGTPGHGGGAYVENDLTGRRRYVSAAGDVIIGEQETWVGVSTGGGGYGNPMDRPVDQVRQDVRDGIVTRVAASAVFGVVVSDDADPIVDEAATAERRVELSKVKLEQVRPDAPGASTWVTRNMREGDVYLLNPVPDRGLS
jgi:N-methylhydantoinase B